MGLFKKQADPISERARDLNAQIAALESEIKKLGNQLDRGTVPSRINTSSSYSAAAVATETVTAPPVDIPHADPVFEEVDQKPLKTEDAVLTAEHFNEMGVRKYDLPGLVRRIKNFIQGQPAANPKLVSYLAAGSVQGLRPLRYEKRVARNRFIFWAVILLLMIWGILAWILHH